MTESLPKPLVPVWNRPLIEYAFEHLIHDLSVEAFAVNTHHCPEAYAVAYPEGRYRDLPIEFRHEPILLDTAGGIANLRDWLPRDESFVVYNGDILTDLPLAEAWARHCESENLVTMVLRSEGDELRVGFDPESGRVIDLRGQIAPDWPLRYQFTGIYFVDPAFVALLEPGKIESVVLPMLRCIAAGEAIGGIVVDEGAWSDLGERNAYLDALKLRASGFPRYLDEACRISPDAKIGEGAHIDEFSAVGAGVRVGAGASVRESVVWDGGVVESGATLERVVVRGGQVARGTLRDRDL